jgi:hypothetical protein
LVAAAALAAGIDHERRQAFFGQGLRWARGVSSRSSWISSKATRRSV